MTQGGIIWRVNKMDGAWGPGLTAKAVWHIVKSAANVAGIATVAPRDLRRTCARLCHSDRSELEQIQFLLGHVSIQTTERYLGYRTRCKRVTDDGLPTSGVSDRKSACVNYPTFSWVDSPLPARVLWLLPAAQLARSTFLAWPVSRSQSSMEMTAGATL